MAVNSIMHDLKVNAVSTEQHHKECSNEFLFYKISFRVMTDIKLCFILI